MDDLQKARARRMVDQLKSAETNCGLLAEKGIVVMRCPGTPYTDTPTTFDESDLTNAIALGLLRKQKMVGSFEWDYYVVNEPLGQSSRVRESGGLGSSK
jgi:hypothetical protein